MQFSLIINKFYEQLQILAINFFSNSARLQKLKTIKIKKKSDFEETSSHTATPFLVHCSFQLKIISSLLASSKADH